MKLLALSVLMVFGLVPQATTQKYPKCDKVVPDPPELYECPNGQPPNAKCVRSCDATYVEFMEWAVQDYCRIFESAWKEYIDKVDDCMEWYDICITLSTKTPEECHAETNECLDTALGYLWFWLDKAENDYLADAAKYEKFWHDCYAVCCGDY